MGHTAPKMEMRIRGKKHSVQGQSNHPDLEAQTDVLSQDVGGLPAAPEPRSNACPRPSRPGQTKAAEAMGKQKELVLKQEKQNRGEWRC